MAREAKSNIRQQPAGAADVVAQLGLDPTDGNGSQPRARAAQRPDVWQASAGPTGRAIVVGAGVTGLTTAWQLAAAGVPVLVLEATQHVGGMASTFKHKDFLLDLGPHKFFSVMAERMRLAGEIIGQADFLTVPRCSHIRLHGRFLRYPIGALDVLQHLGPGVVAACGVDYLWRSVRSALAPRPTVSYEDWLVSRFGRKLYDLVFGPYAWKVWGDPRQLARELAELRVAVPGLLELLWRLLLPRRDAPAYLAAEFRYPRLGSGEFSRRLAELVLEQGGAIQYGSPVVQVAVNESAVRSLRLRSGAEIAVQPDDVVVSTAPLGYLAQIVAPALPAAVLAAVGQLKTRHLTLLYVVLDRPAIGEDTWTFFPEARYIFTRISEQKRFSAAMCPADQTCLCLEIVEDEGAGQVADADLYSRAITDLEETGLVKRSEVSEYFVRRLRHTYPVLDLDYRRNVAAVLGHLDGIRNLYSVGRQGGFNYVGQIDCFDIGLTTAEHILRREGKATWAAARQRFANYVVLD